MSFLGGFFKFVAGAVLIGVGAIPGLNFLQPLGFAQLFSGASDMLVGDRTPQQGALEANTADPQSPLPVVYGRAKLGLRLVDMRVGGGSDNKYLYIVGALCHGSSDGNGIEAIDEIYFNERRAFDASGNPEGWLKGKAALERYLGTDTQAVSSLMHAAFPTEWPSTSKGRGVAYLVLRLEFDAEVFGTGIPNVTAIVRGCKVPDVTNLAAASRFSTNPADCLYDYLTSTRYGIRVPAGDIDASAFADMANYYNTGSTTIPDTGRWARSSGLWIEFTGSGAFYPSYLTNTVLDVSQSAKANIQQLLTSCRGNLVYQDGQYRLFTRRVTTPTSFVLSEANLVGGLQIQTAGVSECPNVLRYTYVEPGEEEATDGITYAPPFAAITQYYPRPEASNPYLDDDNGFEVVHDLQLPATAPPYMAERIAIETFREMRGVSPAGPITVQCVAKQEAAQLQVGDLVPLSHSTPGWTLKPFWVMAIGSLGNGLVGLSLFEYNAAAYALDTQDPFPVLPATNLPNPFTVAPPTGVTLVSDATTVVRTVDGGSQPAINATWTASVDPYVDYYEVEAKRATDSAYMPFARPARDNAQATVAPVTAFELWNVRVRAVNTLGRASDWVAASVTTGAAVPTTTADARNLLVNGNGEQGVIGDAAPGWTLVTGEALVVTSDAVKIGTRALKIVHGT